MADLELREVEGAVLFKAKIVPGSSKTAMCGLIGGMLKVKVSAPPQKGKANQCLCEFLAKQLGVKKNAVTIVSGQSRPVKSIQVSGISAKSLLGRLNLNEQDNCR
ncbi:MAG: DUF167 domain-containing protein [Planctomycetota bacterium]|jgi:uncharacterized protein (TIGR00251 family)